MDTNSALDILWILLAGILVFFMQAGFAMVEAGFTRQKCW
jgi:Amt family ammonium transporter